MYRRKALLSDTVGFISDLPVQVTKQAYLFILPNNFFHCHLKTFILQLVEAFHATLEEVVEADLLVV